MSQPMDSFCAASWVPQSPIWLDVVSQSAHSGNGTPIGASANVVGTAIAEKDGYRIGGGRYCKHA
jgi:Na+/H+ antiporter NhaD/arsenite permease-like protein